MKTLFTLLVMLACQAQAETFSAQVIMVMDGDTVMVLRGGQKLKVRMANIDAPEKDQPFGMEARASLQQLVGKRQVQVDTQAVDQYGRMVGTLLLDGRNINQEQVRRGMAWEYSHYHTDRTFIGLQSEAQGARRGLWQQASPQAPWQWRKLHPSTGPAAQANGGAASGHAAGAQLYDLHCGRKRHCAQMASCDEAYFYLNRCGVKTLDRNKDGVPCESLCVAAGKR